MNNNEYKDLEKELLEDERISLFLQGKMNHEEETVFLKELKQNDELRQRAIVQARLIKGMKQADEELFEAFQQADLQDVNKIIGVQQKKSPARWLAIAASVIFIVFVGFKSYDYYDTTNLGKEYANTFPISNIIRGDANSNIENELATLFNNIVEGKDLDNTTSRLANLWELSKQDIYNDYTDFAPYIGWNLAIGYLEDYEKTKAQNVLAEMELLYDSETIIGKKVRELKKEFQ
jgi:hypothetical protein